MSILRKTSSYLLEIESANPVVLLDKMIQKCTDLGHEVDTSGVNRGKARLRFRSLTNDNVALNVALQIADGRPFVLLTGYGVNQREVAQ